MTENLYTEYRKLLFPIAYNMLGSASDAEDIVQETLLKWLSLDKKDIENIKGYLVKTLINKCLNHIRDRKKESSRPEIAPELLRDFLPGIVEKEHTLSLGVRAMLEKLSSMERAVFLLKEVFDYSHREIAEMLGISEAYCRQILARARRHMKEDRQRFEVNPEHHLLLYQTFIEVCRGENLSELLEILREDIEVEISRPAASLTGKLAVAEFLLQHHRMGFRYELIWLKDMPAIVAYLFHQPVRIIRLDGEEGMINSIHISSATQKPISLPAHNSLFPLQSPGF